MRALLLTELTIALALTSAPVSAEKPPISLAKTSKWEINYDDDSCHLLAKFGEGDQSAIIRLTRFEPGSKFDLVIYGKPFEVADVFASAKIGFGLTAPLRRDALSGKTGEKLPLLVFSSVRLDNWVFKEIREVAPIVSPEQEAKADVIDLSIAGTRHFRLETGSFKTPMEAMRTCTTDLVKHWGYDPEQQAALTRPPAPLKSPAGWLQDGDFPMGAMGHNGLVQFRLDIDAGGNVTGCSILHRTNPDDFADLTCKLIAKRAKFTPALDKEGKPVRSYFINKVRWLTAE